MDISCNHSEVDCQHYIENYEFLLKIFITCLIYCILFYYIKYYVIEFTKIDIKLTSNLTNIFSPIKPTLSICGMQVNSVLLVLVQCIYRNSSKKSLLGRIPYNK